MPSASLTWADLTAAEPRLLELDADARRMAATGDHCASTAWCGPDGLKRRMFELVGWRRRASEWRAPVSVAGGGPWKLGDLMRRYRSGDEPGRVAALAEDIAHGVEFLWTSESYDVAYQHLLAVVGDCAEGGACRCWE